MAEGRVDGVNTFHVSPGRLTSFGVLSASFGVVSLRFAYFPVVISGISQGNVILFLVRFPASSAWLSRLRFPPGSYSAMTELSQWCVAELSSVNLC